MKWPEVYLVKKIGYWELIPVTLTEGKDFSLFDDILSVEYPDSNEVVGINISFISNK